MSLPNDNPFSDTELKSILGQIKDEADRLEQSDCSVIKATPHAWSVRHDGDDYSIEHMGDIELQQVIVEDLLMLFQWEKKGKQISFAPHDLKRFVPDWLHARVDVALSDPHLRSFLMILSDGQIRIHPDHLQDAMDFCGVWLEGFEPLTDGVVYYGNPEAMDDMESDQPAPGI